MFGLGKKKGDELPDEEWNFTEILEWDADACLLYELAREIEHPEAYFSTFASREQTPFVLESMPITPREDREASSDFKQVRATMYIRPFDVAGNGQELREREMLPGLYFLHPDKTFRGYPDKLGGTPWLALDDSWQGNLQLYTEQFLTGITFHSIAESQNWEKRHPTGTKEVSGLDRWQMLTVKVDWSKGDQSLIEGFTAWLQKQRPKEFPSKSSTGRQSTADSLNALSALRLRHRYTIEDAIKHTKAVNGKPLYGDRSSWDRAQRRALHLFSKVFPGAGIPRSESKISNRKN